MPYQQLPITPYEPQQVDPIGLYSRLAAIKGAQQEQQLREQQVIGAGQENQIRAEHIKDQQAVDNAYHDALTQDESGNVKVDSNKLSQALAASGHGSAVPGILKNIQDYQKSATDLQEAKGKVQAQAQEAMGFLGSAIQQAKYDPNLADMLIEQHLRSPNASPQELQQLQQMRQAIQQNPELLKTLADSYVAQAPKQQEMQNARTVAGIRAAPAQQQADTATQRLKLETPALQVKSQNAVVDEQLAQQAKRAEIAKSIAETTKAKIETANLGQQPIFAVDPATNERVMTTRPEAQEKGYTNTVSVKESDVAKETDARAMINDVQLNKSRYMQAMQRVYSEPVTAKQAAAIAALVPEKLGLDFGHFFSLNLPDVMQKVTNATAFSELSPAQKEAMIGYYSTLASVPAAQKALTNIGRANKEMMDLELRTIPTPLMDKESFGIGLDRFQGNIDQTSRKTVRMPGMPSTSEIRKLYEGGQSQSGKPSSPFMQMPKAIQPKGSSKILTKAQVQQAATDNKVSYAEAEAQAERQGYTIQ